MNMITIKKIVNTVCDTMFTYFHGVCEVRVDFDRAHKLGLAASISNCLEYIETKRTGAKNDILISFSDYDNAINIYTTSFDDNGKCKGYRYLTCIHTDKKNQIEITAELCMQLQFAHNTVK